MRTLLVAVAALAAAAPVAAGGFATVGISPPPSGESLVWEATITVRAHGVTPVDGLEPVLTIQNTGSGELRRFSAEPVGSGGEYRFRVEFPGPGTWDYTVADGYAGHVHTFRPVTIAPAAGGTTLALPWTAVGSAALLGALALVVLLRRRRAAAAAPAAVPH